MKRAIMAIFVALGMIISGCTVVRPVVPESGHYYINPDADFSRIAKVVLLEPQNRSSYPNLSRQISQSVCQELQKKHLFNIRTLDSDDPQWQNLELDKLEYSLDQQLAIREQLNADAVITGTITEYRPYPHMLIGLNMKMMDLRDGMTVWGMEQIWDSTDMDVEKRMRIYYGKHMRHGYEPMNWQVMLTSSRAFNKFVAYEVTRTLPRANEYMNLRLSSENTKNFRKIRTIPGKTLQTLPKPLKLEPLSTTIGM